METTEPVPARERSAEVGPVSGSNRAEILDVLRGFALFGILLTHVPSFSGYDYLPPDRAVALDAYGIDRFTVGIVDLLVDGKFVALFSLLFGVGFAIQMRHLDSNDERTRRRFLRRTSFLLAIGLAHTFLLWQGDILTYYALLGFVLLLFRSKPPRKLILYAMLSLTLAGAGYGAVYGVYNLAPDVLPLGEGGASAYMQRIVDITGTFASGSYAEVLAANFSFWLVKVQWILFDGRLFTIFGLFLLGAALGKLEVHYRLREYQRAIWIALGVCGIVGFAGSALVVYLRARQDLYPPTAMGIFETLLAGFARPSLGIAYAAALCLLASTAFGRIADACFAAPGRMALTTYLSQTVLCIALFYGFGVGLSHSMGHVESLLTAVLLFMGQSLVCRWWLARFRYGPVEWVWRQFTYGRRLPLRISARSAPDLRTAHTPL